MRCHRPFVGAIVALFAGVAINSTQAAATPCTNLQSLQLQHTTINSATDNDSGTFVAPGNPPTTITGLPPFCRVVATLIPSSDSSIKVEVWLPKTGWNGRFLGTGGGGFQGVITYASLANGLKGGFAATNSDLGTGSSGCNPLFCGSAGNMGNPLAIQFGDPAAPSTGLFGHPERIKDFGYRAIHLMTVRGKEIVNAFYGQRAQRAYFAGCSTGGQNALMEAQRFPNDYDGILAGAPAFNRTHLHMAGLFSWQNAHASPGRFIQAGQMTLVNQAVLKQCVGRDGGASTDQFLTDPRACRFDPKILLCTGGKVPPACLTADQVTTMQKYYAGTVDPVNGQLVNPGSQRGNETDDVLALGLAFQERLPEPAFDGLFYWVFGPSFGYPSSPVSFANFDFHHDIKKVDDQLADVLNATSTDLGEFREHGGKLIMYHGWADPLIPSQSSINYFNALVGNENRGVQQASFFPGGGSNPALRRTQSYARLFMVPGMYHCSGGPGPNTFDALTPLVTWVETGTPPETILATKFVADTPPAVQMTRPLCVFPKVPKYSGSGDASKAANFACVVHDDEFNQTPAPKYGP
ncbi:tannase/feruloyl esterase family alpha/beta hydrolase [Bradyrhizobium sp. WSM 1704]|uniref:tannase/feruloyl esterase family alpha/beta hydrolase n=1 Tax=Bradyrhizobium semiaridum TaxID=2821404 RepID=UPI001CE39380|nr:tannase/feruloyl esterase family alpha/beta hydrolase [Bradyrhizobium semiaridum]MCA6124849.1 tannase/feruloyl esterase family alpha/beta hydrolase [Bradyrhizobium semiaridum]